MSAESQQVPPTDKKIDLSQLPPYAIMSYLQDALEGTVVFQIEGGTVRVDELIEEFGRRQQGSEFNRP